MTEIGSRIGSRRPSGSGSIYRDRHYWVARIYLEGNHRVLRKRHTREDADVALLEMKVQYADRLGYHYQTYPKRTRFGEDRPAPRSGVTARVRFDILTRDGYRCVYCGATAQEARLHIDHRVPVSLGGSDEPANLATACAECNLGKASRP